MSRPYFNVKALYTGTGSLSEYSFDFKITKLEKIRIVVVDDLNNVIQNIRGDDTSFIDHVELDTTVVDEQPTGGVVHLVDPLPAGYRMALVMDDANPTQDYKFRNKTSFSLKRFEDALDAIVGAIQGFVLRAKQGIRISDLDDESTFDGQLPAGLVENGANRVIAINEDGNGVVFGPTLIEIAAAEAAALQAVAAAEAAELSAETAEDAALEAQTLLFDGNLDITYDDSPVNMEPSTYNSKIVFVDATDGDIDISLQTLVGYPAGFKVQLIRKDDSVNKVMIYPFTDETIDGMTSYQFDKGLTVILSPERDSLTNWKKKFIGLVNGGSTLPTGGDDYSYVEAQGGAAIWENGVFEGFSARYNTALSLQGIRAALNYVFQFQYLGPLASLSASGSGTIREKGVAVTASTLTATVTKRSTAISRIQFFLNGTSINDNNPPANIGSGNTVYNWSGSITDNSTFRVDVTDTTDGANGPTTVSASSSFTFVYPFFWGSAAPDAAVAALTKQVVANSNNRNVSYTGLVTQKFYYAFPTSYGDLTSIKDVNNFEVLGSFTKKAKTWSAADGATVPYTIYELTTALGVGLNTSFTFIR